MLQGKLARLGSLIGFQARRQLPSSNHHRAVLVLTFQTSMWQRCLLLLDRLSKQADCQALYTLQLQSINMMPDITLQLQSTEMPSSLRQAAQARWQLLAMRRG